MLSALVLSAGMLLLVFPKMNAGEKDCPTVRLVLSKFCAKVGFFYYLAFRVMESGSLLSCEEEVRVYPYSKLSLTIFPFSSCHPSKA